MDLSIIIVSWNTRDLLLKCLHSIFNHPTGNPLEVWVVDNASSDGSVQMVRESFPQVHLIVNQKNLGFAAANNQAIRHSAGDYLLLLNPDTEVKPSALEELIRFMEDHPKAGAAGPRLLNPDGSLQTSVYPAPTLSREFWRLFHLDSIKPYGSYRMKEWDLTTPRVVDVLLGACMILREEALKQVGYLDEDFFMYSEEVDLCYRLKRTGWLCYWVPQAEVVHFGGQSTSQIEGEMFQRLYQSKLLYFRKHHGWKVAQVYKWVLLAAILTRLTISPLAWLEQPPRRNQHLRLASHYRHLLAVLPEL